MILGISLKLARIYDTMNIVNNLGYRDKKSMFISGTPDSIEICSAVNGKNVTNIIASKILV